MVRLASAIAVVLVSPLVAAAYGALHDQVTYTLSPEYYTHLKFDQFRIPAGMHDRVGVALVGVLATWWVGPPIGLCLAPFLALRRPAQRAPWRTGLARVGAALATVIGVAALCGALGYALGRPLAPTQEAAAALTPTGVTDPIAYLRVGSMHNASYLGGALGLVVAMGRQVVALWRERRQSA
ncbi:signal peptide-containing protein [Engelhardtia mirabilis]|uniref:Uncharacterized protein n=1 Tax=Engelhardtia mirabilis TaxID=2528011 RepID=A0A518BDM5_9BACT|nr:hypothetical protein Pla133_01520 [Planctomycetes bacterium Pla133]QDU99415.1 hypothetical protein Pla86_01520 [Planctomycetes bacterium Pla86]